MPGVPAGPGVALVGPRLGGVSPDSPALTANPRRSRPDASLPAPAPMSAPQPQRPAEPLPVLMDYDNLPRADLRRGLPAYLTHLLSLLPVTALPHRASAVCRLYGGWYEERRLSRRAKDLAGVTGEGFPPELWLSSSEGERAVRVSVELARSLRIKPGIDFFHTYRQRGAPRGLAARSLPFAGCAQPHECPLGPVHDLLARDACPAVSCGVAVSDVVTRAEQKLVDAMLTADLIHASRTALRGGRPQVAVVTNDDDIWPGIYMAVSEGAQVHHIRPTPRKQWPYAAVLSSGYAEYSPRPSGS